MGYQIQETVRRVAKFSIIMNVVTVLLAQLDVTIRHVFIFSEADLSSPTIQNGQFLDPEETCNAVMHPNIAVLGMILMVVICFCFILDLPVNVMLLVALGTNDRSKYIPWLIVTGIKLIGCTVIICITVFITFDDAFENLSAYEGTHHGTRLSINRYIFYKA